MKTVKWLMDEYKLKKLDGLLECLSDIAGLEFKQAGIETTGGMLGINIKYFRGEISRMLEELKNERI